MRTLYHVADPYLRLWLRFTAERVPEIARGRGDVVVAYINDGWPSYAGAAIEPLVCRSIERIVPDRRFGGARYIGSHWARDRSFQVDVSGAAHEKKNERVELRRAARVVEHWAS